MLCFYLIFISFLYIDLINCDSVYCFTGSSAYQLLPKNCNKASNYTGTWYCSTMEICEPFARSDRDCMTVRGCATAEQCTDQSGTSLVDTTKSIMNSNNGATLGGASIRVSCCQNDDLLSDDDAIAADLSDICNSASSSFIYFLSTTILLISTNIVLISLAFFY